MSNEVSEGSERLRVMVVDDHALFRRGLEMVLQQEADIELVGEASDGAEAVERAQELMPDVVLMDVRMPKRSGIEAAGQIKDLLPHCKILMLTISDEEADLYDAIKAGASGYLLKEIPIDEVADAIRSVWAGQSRISPSMASKLLTEFAAMSKAAEEQPQMPAPKLTDREMEVLRLVAQGLNNRDIAKQLFISENTVKNHIRNILEKLHLHSRMEAVVYAVREKMIEISLSRARPHDRGSPRHPRGLAPRAPEGGRRLLGRRPQPATDRGRDQPARRARHPRHAEHPLLAERRDRRPAARARP